MKPGHNKQNHILCESSPVGKMDCFAKTAAFIYTTIRVGINPISQDGESNHKRSHRHSRNPAPQSQQQQQPQCHLGNTKQHRKGHRKHTPTRKLKHPQIFFNLIRQSHRIHRLYKTGHHKNHPQQHVRPSFLYKVFHQLYQLSQGIELFGLPHFPVEKNHNECVTTIHSSMHKI